MASPLVAYVTAFKADMDQLGLDQKTLGQRMDVTQQAVSNWLTTGRIPIPRAKMLASMVVAHGLKSAMAALLDEPFAVERIQRAYRTDGYGLQQPVMEFGQAVPLDVPPLSDEGPERPMFSRRGPDAPPSDHRTTATSGGGAAMQAAKALEERRAEYKVEISEFVNAFKAKLPEALRQNMNGVVDVLGLTRSFDYVSDRLVLEFKELTPGLDAFAEMKGVLFDMAAVRKAARVGERDRLFILAPIGLHHFAASSLRLQQLMTNASILGVRVLSVAHGDALADLVVFVEHTTLPLHNIDFDQVMQQRRFL